MKKNNILLYLCIAIFGIVGIYSTFIAGNINKYDSQTKTYQIYPNKTTNSDGTMYYPIYYFKANGKEFQCETKGGSSSIPNENKNIVYYDSKDPENCKTQYEKSSNKTAGIICLIVTAVMIILTIKKPSTSTNEFNQIEAKEIDIEKQQQFNENIQKTEVIIGKIMLIYKRIILGIIIAVLLVITLIDTVIIKQTIIAKDYIETTATYVDKKTNEESEIFDDYIYTFKDKKGNQQEIIISISKDRFPENEIKLKYNENNPQDYYEETATMDKSGIIWYIVKIIVIILLVILFFNKKLLSKVHIFASRR